MAIFGVNPRRKKLTLVITIGGTSRPGPTFPSLPQPERRHAAKARPKTSTTTNLSKPQQAKDFRYSIHFSLELVDLAGFGHLRRVMASTTIDGGKRKAVVVGISGASSSGKTTLARLLRDVFPGTFILHEDDFYKPEAECVFSLFSLSRPIPPLCVCSDLADCRAQDPREGRRTGLGLPRGALCARHD